MGSIEKINILKTLFKIIPSEVNSSSKYSVDVFDWKTGLNGAGIL